ncbi:hypothetical protein [Desulfovibrio sp. ZJ369]|uniref:O-antigen ligase family protein n=1 Tax=Desulfovibrio sp. ZJ369 TaxID=2709793 RepID=UPI0013EBE74D|nr:hypothetical protein [Desulfovibrio sp. ZJ369]
MPPASSPQWPLRLFAFLLIPLACWQVWLFRGIPNYYAQHFLLYPCLVFMFWAWRRRLWSVAEAWGVLRPFLPWLVLLFVMQAAAGWQSAQLYLPQNASRLHAVLLGLLKLAAQIPFVLFFAMLCRVLMRDAAARRLLVRGACWTFAALALWCAVQAIYVYGVSTMYYQAGESRSPLRNLVHETLAALSPWLEARWPDSTYDFYSKGAYALTLARFNGFFEEASALAAMIAVFFVPLAFGLLAMAYRGRKFLFAGFSILTCCLAIMILCRSGTGQILAAVTLGLALLFCLRGGGKGAKTLITLALAAGCVYAAMNTPHIHNYLLKRSMWQNVSNLPRVVVTLDTLEMIAKYPLLGVGRNWYFAHLHNGAHYMQNLQDKELRDWKEKGSGGELSALPALGAQYGLPLLALAFAFTGSVWLRLHTLHRIRPADNTLSFATSACTAWLVLGFVASLAALDVRNPLFSLPFFCFYALSQHMGLEDSAGSGTA